MVLSRRAAVVAALVASVPVASAGAQCWSSRRLQIDVPGVTTFYYDERIKEPPCPGGCPLEVWIYEEANGQAGLQRGGVNWLLGDFDAEICIESATPDKLWL